MGLHDHGDPGSSPAGTVKRRGTAVEKTQKLKKILVTFYLSLTVERGEEFLNSNVFALRILTLSTLFT